MSILRPLVIVTMFELSACGGTRFAIKDPAASPSDPPPKPVSSLTAEVTVDLGPLEMAATRALPNPLAEGGEAGFLGCGYNYHVEHGPVDLVGAGPEIQTTVPVSALAKAWCLFVVSCDPALSATWASSISVDTAWAIATKTTPRSRLWNKRCLVSFLNIDITDKFDPAVANAMAAAAGGIDGAAAQLALRPALQTAWDAIQKPIPLDAASGLNLVLSPSGLGIGAIRGLGKRIAFDITVAGSPTVADGDYVPPPVIPLPSNTGSSGGSFAIYADLRIPYAQVEGALNKALPAQLRLDSSRSITVKHGRVIPNADGIAVGLEIDGDATGTLWIWGRPISDPVTHTLSLSDLDFTIESHNVLVNLAQWLLHGRILELVRKNATVSIADQCSDIASKANAVLNPGVNAAQGVLLQGAVAPPTILGVYPTSNALVAVGQLIGTAKLHVTPPIPHAIKANNVGIGDGPEFIASPGGPRFCGTPKCIDMNTKKQIPCSNPCNPSEECKEPIGPPSERSLGKVCLPKLQP